MPDLGDLLAFLRQQLDHDERVARAATAGPWRYNPDKAWRDPNDGWRYEEAVFTGPEGTKAICVAATGDGDDPQSMADAAHIALNDPQFRLAEIKATRRILDLIELAHTREADRTTDDDGVYLANPIARRRLRDVLYQLAQPYAGRPGWREEWRTP